MIDFLINKFEADIAYDYLNKHIGIFNEIEYLDRRGDKIKEELNSYSKDIIDFINYKSNSEKDKKNHYKFKK